MFGFWNTKVRRSRGCSKFKLQSSLRQGLHCLETPCYLGRSRCSDDSGRLLVRPGCGESLQVPWPVQPSHEGIATENWAALAGCYQLAHSQEILRGTNGWPLRNVGETGNTFTPGRAGELSHCWAPGQVPTQNKNMLSL